MRDTAAERKEHPVTDPLRVARYLVDRMGFSVLPVPMGGKIPGVKWRAFQGRQPTDAELVRWFKPGKNNVGIISGPISGIVCVDVDDPEAEEYVKSRVPLTEMMTKTLRGTHRVYRYPDYLVGNRAGIHAPDGRELKLDIRGRGGYFLSPGSLRSNDFRTEAVGKWRPEVLSSLPVFNMTWLEDPIPPPPPRRTDYLTPAFDRAEKWMLKRDPAIEGSHGDHFTYVTVCWMVRDFGLGEVDAMDLLLRWNQRCVPAWRPEELLKKVRNVMGARQYA